MKNLAAAMEWAPPFSLTWSAISSRLQAFDPRNLIIMMASPFSGTFMPGSGRCEVQGLGPGLYPIEWFGHSNFGGRFTAQLKFAGWDGIVVEGASDKPVWINIINDQVKIEDAPMASGAWTPGIRSRKSPGASCPSSNMANGRNSPTTAIRPRVPAVVCCGPAGERKSRIGVPASRPRIPGCIVRLWRRVRIQKPQGDQRDRQRQRAHRRSQGVHGCQALVPPVPMGCGQSARARKIRKPGYTPDQRRAQRRQCHQWQPASGAGARSRMRFLSERLPHAIGNCRQQ